MDRLHRIVDALIGLRKLAFVTGGIVFLGIGMSAITTLFIVSWCLKAGVISGDNLEAVYIAGFTQAAIMVGAYLAINVCNKWVSKWIKKKR
jgi:hypothetical protein